MPIYYNEDGFAREFDNVYVAMNAGYYFTKPPEGDEPDTEVELEVAPVADFVREADGTFYYFFQIPLIDEQLYAFYTSDTLFDGQDFQEGTPDEILGQAVNFGNLAQVPEEYRGLSPVDYFISEIKAEAVKNPFLLEKEAAGATNQLGEDIGGQYSVLNAYLESLFEGKTYGYDDYAVRSTSSQHLNPSHF